MSARRLSTQRTKRWFLFHPSPSLVTVLIDSVSSGFTLPSRLSASPFDCQHGISSCTSTAYLLKGKQRALQLPHEFLPLSHYPRHVSNPLSNSSGKPDLTPRLGWSYRPQRQKFHTTARRDAIPLIPAAVGIFKVRISASKAADEVVHLHTRRRYRHIPCLAFLLSNRHLRDVEDQAWCPLGVIRGDKAQDESRSRSVLEDVV